LIKNNTKLVILDRDGVINRDLGDYVRHPGQLHLLGGAVDAIAMLKKNGYIVAIATNQAGIGHGFYSHRTLADIHCRLLLAVRTAGGDIDRIVYCPSADDAHPWRKPNAGMLEDLMDGFSVCGDEVVFIGDSLSDMIAGERARCRLMLVQTGKGRRSFEQLALTEYQTLKAKVKVVADLHQAARFLCGAR